MKKIIYTGLMFIALLTARAQTNRFNLTPATWPTPTGGEIEGSSQLGFNTTSGAAVTGQALTSQSWNLIDLNGDKKPDLVVTSALGASGVAQFNASTTPDWQVYMNTGAGFSGSATTWSTPQGGAPLLGFNFTGSSATNYVAGAQKWDLVDMDGDGKPDLVVTSQTGISGPMQFGANTANQSWKVYLNTGSGFSSTASTWLTPTGGAFNITGDTILGFTYTSGTGVAGQGTGSQSWSLVDMDGDGKPDLVVTAGLTANGPAQQTVPNTEWQVYLNNGTRFSATPTTWVTPAGGSIVSGHSLGYNAINGDATGQSTNSQTWSLADINGDKKPDLVVTGTVGSDGVTETNATTTPTWSVYLNTGTGFSNTAISWSTPQGGFTTSGSVLTGFNNLANYASLTNQGTNSQTWVTTDMNGDGKPDLVVTASVGSLGARTWSPGASDYWQVYLNNGTTGFAANATFWFIPNGGENNGHYLGFNSTFHVSLSAGGDANGSTSWSLTDLDGTGFPDLVQQGVLATAGNTEGGAGSSPYWQVYRNADAPLGTGIEANNQASFACKLYPNPNNGNFKLVFADDVVRQVEVTDITGQRILSNIPVSQQADIELPSFAQGIYFVTIRQNGLTEVMKVSVTK